MVRKTLEERFWAKVDKNGPNGCWIWLAAKTPPGYGVISSGSKLVYAHRLAYGICVGAIPCGKLIDHICHNPSCVNPKHLRVCAHAENNRNAVISKNNASGFKGVHIDHKTGNWKAEITSGGVAMTLGTFTTPNSAHIAYRNAARDLNGEFANFGHTDPKGKG